MVITTLLIVTLIFAFLFGNEWKKQKRAKNEQFIPFALMILYLFLFLNSSIMCYFNFFADPNLANLLANSKYYFLSVINFIGIVTSIQIFIAERIIRKNTKHFFLIYFIFFIVLLITFKVLDVPIFTGYYFILSIPLWTLLALFIYKLVWKISGQLRQKMIIATIGYTIFCLAIVYEMWLILRGEEVALLFEIKGLILLAAILMGYGFYTIPSFTEFDWDKKIRHLYILNLNGLCLLQQPFKKQSIDEDLLGGSLMAVQSLMKEMIQSDKFLQIIDHGDAKIIFERTPHAIGIIIAEEDLYILHYKLQQLLKEFDLLFGSLMKDWTGNLDIFKPFHIIVNKIFEIKPARS